MKCENVSEDDDAIKEDDTFHCEDILKCHVQVTKYFRERSKDISKEAHQLEYVLSGFLLDTCTG